jgi:hypothetical protein
MIMTGHAKLHANRTRSVAAGRKSVGYVAALARAATKGVAVDGVAAEERDRRAAGGMGWLDIGNGVGKPASAGGVGSAVTCAASASKAWVVAWLAASSLPSPVAPLVDNVVGNVGHHRHRGLEDTSRWGWDLPTSKQGRI